MRSALAPITAFAIASLVGSVSACGSSDSPAGGGSTAPQSIFAVPTTLSALADTAYYDLPWPSDLRREADHTIRVQGMFDPTVSPIVESYVKLSAGLLDGFSPTSSGYLRFTVPIDTTTLPSDPKASLDPGSSVQLVDVDPASPEKGQRHLLETLWRQDQGLYWLANTLAVQPALGYPLRPKTRYAIVVTDAIKTADGQKFSPSDDLKQVLDLAPVSDRVKAAHDTMAPDVATLAGLGIAKEHVVHLTTFTTNDPTAELFTVADNVAAQVPAPTVEDGTWKQDETRAHYDVYEAKYSPSPNYQQGNIPFSQPSDGGNFQFGPDGKPVLQGTFDMRFTLVVPNLAACPPPANGYPVLLYAHGTGGDYRSIVDEGNSVGDAAAVQCIASVGVDQIFHGARPGAPPESDPNREGDIELEFFNLNNPIAARTNGRQGAVDVIQEARLFTETHLVLPAAISRTGVDIHFDSTKIVFFGHSQGGVNGPLYLAAANTARGGVLSGTGAMITVALLEKTQPQPSVAAAVKTLLGLSRPENQDELNLFNPVINLAQTIIDATDPVNYMPYIIKNPRPGFAPKSIYQTEGVNEDGSGDSYAPPHGIEIASVAMGLPVENPQIHPITEASWSGLGTVDVPAGGLSGNLANGQASGVLGQFHPAAGSDGHFVVFDIAACRTQAAVFEKNLLADPKGNVPPEN